MGGPSTGTSAPGSGGHVASATHLPRAVMPPFIGPETQCRTNRDARPAAHIEPHSEDETSERSRRPIICTGCGYRITNEDQRIRVNGTHDHRCVNPHGLMFHIGCFGDATGCQIIGLPTTEFTWFRGFAWSMALCGGCGSLLGWQYHGSEFSFFGLILDRLAVGGEPSP